ncbi:MAG: hypothetical protein C4297_08780 [Gemmataceae bacterium]
MGGHIYLGRIGGIPFLIHWSWFLAVLLIAWSVPSVFFPDLEGTVPGYLLGVAAALGLFASVLLHELGHALIALQVGIPVRSIRLFIFGGVAEIAGEPRRPGHEIVVAIGGPAVTLFLIVSAFLSYVLLGGTAWMLDESGRVVLRAADLESWRAISARLLLYLLLANAVLLVFNLIPAFPLDGGRVLRATIWGLTGNYLSSTRIAGYVGIAFGWLLILFGAGNVLIGGNLSGIWSIFLGLFLQNAAQQSIATAQVEELLGGIRVGDIMRRQPVAIPAHTLLANILEDFFLRYPYKAYPVVEDGRLVGMFTLHHLKDVPRDEWDMLDAAAVVTGDGNLPVLHPNDLVLAALRKMNETGYARLPVVENGLLVGILSKRDILGVLEVRSGLAEAGWRKT